MAYVQERQFKSSFDMLASAKAVRNRLWTKPKPVVSPVITAPVQKQKSEIVWLYDQNEHVVAYYRHATNSNWVASAISVEKIIKKVSAYFDISEIDLKSARRTRSIARPRQVAMYLSKVLTMRSLPEIGRRFNGRDHTTVLHSIRTITELKETDPVIAKAITELTKMINGEAMR